MSYVAGTTSETGCVFCNRLNRSEDVTSLILYRGNHSFVIMNLYPYNTGHVMLVPNQHAADLEELDRETLHEMSEMLPFLTRALKRAFNCGGFNIGLNLGAIAGAGVAAHLHQHIVPRWQGDANFMPILARTMTIPELIPVTYAKIRAELQREHSSTIDVSFVFLSEDISSVLLYQGNIPAIALAPGVPIMQAIQDALPTGVTGFALAGWAGDEFAGPRTEAPIALTLLGSVASDLPDDWSMIHIKAIPRDTGTMATLERALGHLAPEA